MFMPQKGYVHAAKGVCSCRKIFFNPFIFNGLKGVEIFNTVNTVNTVNGAHPPHCNAGGCYNMPVKESRRLIVERGL